MGLINTYLQILSSVFQRINNIYITQNDKHIQEEQPQQDAQHSIPDLEAVNIQLSHDEKKMSHISSGDSESKTNVAPQKVKKEKKQPQIDQQGEQQVLVQTGKASFFSQFFHCLFKLAAILFFLFINLALNDSTITFVLVVLLDVFDFWTVKNVTGRKLVGLRWYSEILEDGTEVWRYESKDANFQPNDFNAQVFWFIQVIAVLTWFVLSFLELFGMHFFWGLLAVIGLVFTSLNLLGFYKCRGEHQKKAKEYMAKIGFKAMQKAM